MTLSSHLIQAPQTVICGSCLSIVCSDPEDFYDTYNTEHDQEKDYQRQYKF